MPLARQALAGKSRPGLQAFSNAENKDDDGSEPSAPQSFEAVQVDDDVPDLVELEDEKESSNFASSISAKPPSSARPTKFPPPPYSSPNLDRIKDQAVREVFERIKYKVNLDELHREPLLRGKYLQLDFDDPSVGFVTSCLQQFNTYSFKSVMSCLLRPALAYFMGHSDLNGYLETGQMHLVSSGQLRQLVGLGPEEKVDRLLDVGAGCGRITDFARPVAEEIVTTEVSAQMKKRLEGRGYKCIQTDTVSTVPFDGGFDVVTLYNVIDRCAKPRTLLSEIRSKLKSTRSRLVIATPLPLNQSVEDGTNWVNASESITSEQSCSCCVRKHPFAWEMSLGALIRDIIVPLGYNVVSVSRIPYLSQGDQHRSYYYLDDAVIVVSPTEYPPLRGDPPEID